ncbi:MAG: protein translocase subunit SecF [Deltaproteobacteria bacterium]|nr:protein translocase subunit SecF [Deltaproteobacteria bacterium]
MGRSRFWLTVSGIAITSSILLTIIVGPKYGIDFAGGTEIQVAFKHTVDTGEVRKTLEEIGLPASEVVTFGTQEASYLLRLQAISPVTPEKLAKAKAAFVKRLEGNGVSRFDLSPGGDKLTIFLAKDVPIAQVEKGIVDSGLMLGLRDEREQEVKSKGEDDEEEAAEASKRCESVSCSWPQQGIQAYEVNLKGVADHVMEGLRAKPFGKDAVKLTSEWVGPKAGKQLRDAGIASVAYALLFIMIYIAVRFDLRFAPGAVIALFHDVAIVIGVFVIARIEITMEIVAAVLTVVGYSNNDTIVVYDRIRETLGRLKDREIESVVNRAINETLSRTILSSLTTLITALSLLIIGWNTSIRDFAFAVFLGVIVGTYSSIFIAAPVIVFLEKRFSKLSRKKA